MPNWKFTYAALLTYLHPWVWQFFGMFFVVGVTHSLILSVWREGAPPSLFTLWTMPVLVSFCAAMYLGLFGWSAEQRMRRHRVPHSAAQRRHAFHGSLALTLLFYFSPSLPFVFSTPLWAHALPLGTALLVWSAVCWSFAQPRPYRDLVQLATLSAAFIPNSAHWHGVARLGDSSMNQLALVVLAAGVAAVLTLHRRAAQPTPLSALGDDPLRDLDGMRPPASAWTSHPLIQPRLGLGPMYWLVALPLCVGVLCALFQWRPQTIWMWMLTFMLPVLADPFRQAFRVNTRWLLCPGHSRAATLFQVSRAMWRDGWPVTLSLVGGLAVGLAWTQRGAAVDVLALVFMVFAVCAAHAAISAVQAPSTGGRSALGASLIPHLVLFGLNVAAMTWLTQQPETEVWQAALPLAGFLLALCLPLAWWAQRRWRRMDWSAWSQARRSNAFM